MSGASKRVPYSQWKFASQKSIVTCIVCFHRLGHQKLPDQGRERSRPIWQVRQLEAAGSISLPPFFAFLQEIKKFFLQKYSSWCKKFLHFFIFWIFVSKTIYLNDLRLRKSPNLTIFKKLIWPRFFTENRKISLYTLFSRARNRLETFLGPLFHVKPLYFD